MGIISKESYSFPPFSSPLDPGRLVGVGEGEQRWDRRSWTHGGTRSSRKIISALRMYYDTSEFRFFGSRLLVVLLSQPE